MLVPLRPRIHHLLRRAGFDVVRLSAARFPERRRADLMHRLAIEHVIDVGANIGQYIAELRTNAYQGQIVAFEPLSDAFQVLAEKAREDPRLTVYPFAIGATEEEAAINVAENSYSSSLLPMAAVARQATPEASYVGRQHVCVRTLDSFMLPAGWVKIDVQGSERDVLSGAKCTLQRAKAVEIELSFTTLYEGQLLAWETHEVLTALGFRLASLGNAYHDRATETLLQIDGIYLSARALHTVD